LYHNCVRIFFDLDNRTATVIKIPPITTGSAIAVTIPAVVAKIGTATIAGSAIRPRALAAKAKAAATSTAPSAPNTTVAMHRAILSALQHDVEEGSSFGV